MISTFCASGLFSRNQDDTILLKASNVPFPDLSPVDLEGPDRASQNSSRKLQNADFCWHLFRRCRKELVMGLQKSCLVVFMTALGVFVVPLPSFGEQNTSCASSLHTQAHTQTQVARNNIANLKLIGAPIELLQAYCPVQTVTEFRPASSSKTVSKTVRCDDCLKPLAEEFHVRTGRASNGEVKSDSQVIFEVQAPLLKIENWLAQNKKVNPGSVRTYYAMTGKLPDLKTFAKGNSAREQKKIEAAVSEALGARWPLGATDCLTAAENLANHLSNKLNHSAAGEARGLKYAVQVVDSVPDVNEKVFLDLASLKVAANHYVVRVTQIQSGRTYIADAYLWNSVKLETEVRADHNSIPLGKHQQCLRGAIIRASSADSNFPSTKEVALNFLPLVKSINARNAELAAQYCREQILAGVAGAVFQIPKLAAKLAD